MPIMSVSMSKDVEAGIIIIKSAKNIEEAMKLFSILCDIRFKADVTNMKTVDDYINYKIFFNNLCGNQSQLVKGAGRVKTIKKSYDSIESLRGYYPDDSRKTYLKVIDESILRLSGLKERVEVVHESSFLGG